MLTPRRPFYLPIPDSVFNKLNAGKVNRYTFELLGAPDSGGFYVNRLPGVEKAAVDGNVEVGPVIDFFSAHVFEATIPYTAFIICWSAYRGRKLYLKYQANAQRNYVSNSVILKRLLHIEDPAKITNVEDYNREVRANIKSYNLIIDGLVKKNAPNRYETFQLHCPPESSASMIANEQPINKNDVQFEVLPAIEDAQIEETTYQAGDTVTVTKMTKSRRGNLFTQFENTAIFRKILGPAWTSLILAAFTYWIECITIATFVGELTYLLPILLIIPAVPMLTFLGIYHLQNTHLKKTHEQVEQENQAVLDRDAIVAEANRIFELQQLKKEMEKLQAATQNSLPEPQFSPHTDFDGFNYGAHANARSAAVFLAKAVLVFGLANYISFYFLECVKLATHVFLPAIPIVNLIGFYGFVAFSVVSGIAAMLNHHANLKQNDNPNANDSHKKYTMDELKQLNIDREKQFSQLATRIIKSTSTLNEAQDQPSIELPACVLKFQQAPPFEPDSLLEDIYYFFTENMMGIFCGRALGVLGTALIVGFGISTFGGGILAAVIAGGLIYAGLQMYEKRQSQMKEIIAEIRVKEDNIESAEIKEYNLSMEVERRKQPLITETPSPMSPVSEGQGPSIISISEPPSDDLTDEQGPNADTSPTSQTKVPPRLKKTLQITTQLPPGQIIYDPRITAQSTPKSPEARRRSDSLETISLNEMLSPTKRARIHK